MRKSLFPFVALSFLLIVPSLIFASQCIPQKPAVAFNSASAVFIGKMIEGSEKHPPNNQSEVLEFGKVRFALQEIFKGDFSGNEATILVTSNGLNFGAYGLRREETYVVYAYARASSEYYSTGVCSRTHRLDPKSSKEDLEFLRNLPKAGSGGNIEGIIRAETRSWGGGALPVPNAKVIIRSLHSKYEEGKSNDEGRFKISGLRPGNYIVEINLPRDYIADYITKEISVTDRGTAEADFYAKFLGYFSGEVADKSGAGYPASVKLIRADEDEIDSGSEIHGQSLSEEGGFEITHIPPGKYQLAMMLYHNKDYSKSKRYFYPGTYDRKKAKIFDIGLSQKINKISFNLPDEYQVSKIEGQIFGEDGNSAKNISVRANCSLGLSSNSLYVFAGSQRTVKTDTDGKFSLRVLLGEAYWLDAFEEVWDPKAARHNILRAPGIRVDAGDNMKGLMLTLSEKGYMPDCREILQ